MHDVSPGSLNTLLLRAVSRSAGSSSRHLIDELLREFHVMAHETNPGRAKRWLRSQTTRVLIHSGKDFLSGNPWGPRMKQSHLGNSVDNIIRDIKLALRSIVRTPAHSFAIIATLGIAIGANTGVFSIINGVLLRPLPYPNQEMLVLVNSADNDGTAGSISYPDFRDWREQATSFSEWGAMQTTRGVVERDGVVEDWPGANVTPEVFRVMGVQPLLGRYLTDGDGEPGIGTGIVLGEELWRSEFNADSNVIGQRVEFQERSLTIVGVMPEEFSFPSSTERFWAPLEDTYLERRGVSWLQSVARLNPGVTREAAATEMTRIGAAVAAENDETEEFTGMVVRDYMEAMVTDHRMLMLLLSGAVVLVLAIACANLANLGLTKASAHTKDVAVRKALGAGRGRILSQSLVENIVLASVGGALAIVIGNLVMEFLIAFGPDDLPRRSEIALDKNVLAFTALAAVASGFLFGIGPAIQMARSGHANELRQGSRTGLSTSKVRLLSSLASVQVALAVALTGGAGLLLNSFLRLSNTDPGLQTDHVLTMSVSIPSALYSEQASIDAFHDDVTERLAAIPGVRAVSYSSSLPQSGSSMSATYFVREVGPDTEYEGGQLEIVDGDYLLSLQIPLLSGRTFNDTDTYGSPMNIVVSESFAARHWSSNEEAVGKQVTLDSDFEDGRMMTVIGVAGDVLRRGLDDTRYEAMYIVRPQFSGFFSFVSGRHGFFVVQTDGSGAVTPQLAKAAIQTVEPRALVSDERWMNERIDASLSSPRFRTLIVSTFAGLALLMALIGIYGVMSFGVSQRIREMGVRVALGASPAALMRHVTGSGLKMILPGLGVGIVAIMAGGRLLSSFLFGVQPGDPVTVFAVAGISLVLAIAACMVPARRAAVADPIMVLKAE